MFSAFGEKLSGVKEVFAFEATGIERRWGLCNIGTVFEAPAFSYEIGAFFCKESGIWQRAPWKRMGSRARGSAFAMKWIFFMNIIGCCKYLNIVVLVV